MASLASSMIRASCSKQARLSNWRTALTSRALSYGNHSFTDDANIRRSFDQIHPLPQVALDYDYYDDDDAEVDSGIDNNIEHDASQNVRRSFQNIRHAGNLTRSHPFCSRKSVYAVGPIPDPTSAQNEISSRLGRIPEDEYSEYLALYGKEERFHDSSGSKSIGTTTTFQSRNSRGKRGSGGSGGRYRCPKCGSFVSFRHEDFEENTFYCATCSGWFLVTSNTEEDGGKGDHPSRYAQELKTDGFTRQHAMSYHPNNIKEVFGSRNDGPMDPRLSDREHDTISMNDSISNGTMDAETNEGGFGFTSPPPAPPPSRIPTPIEICNGLDDFVIGQQNVKMALSVGVYNHYKRIAMAESNARREAARKNARVMAKESATDLDLKVSTMLRDPEPPKAFSSVPLDKFVVEGDALLEETCEIDKSNIIIIGPTGSGKTLLVKTLARLIDVPIVIADATCLTQAGYVGEDVESILLKLYHEAGQDLERCQRGIVYIDEADKIRKSGGNISISRDVSGEGVQHALLKIVEGNVINVPKEPGRKNPRGDFLAIDTTNILFICGGAFSGLERIINRRMDAASIGFGAQMKKELDDHEVQGKYFDNAIPKDLIEFGMIPEFVGRFPVIESTKGLEIKDLIDILTVPKNSLMKQYRVLFSKDNVKFHYTTCALEEIAKVAFTRGSGARGLRSITENVLMETMFVVPSIPSCHTVYLDAEAVRGERKPVLLKHPDMTVEKYEELKAKGIHEDAMRAEFVSLRSKEEDESEGYGQEVA